jgi:type II secretory pathway component PulL
LKSKSIEFGIFLIETAILINSKKIDAILLDLASTDSIALLTGVRIARSCSTSCQNWRFQRWLFIVVALRKISG